MSNLQTLVPKYYPLMKSHMGGLPIHHAAVWGQMPQESRVNPGAIEKPGTQKGGIGLIQWTAARRRQYEAFAAAHNKPWQDVETQIEFIMFELGPPDPMRPGSGAYHSKWLLVLRTTTLRAATETVMAYYEGPAGWPQEIRNPGTTTANLPRRLAGAEEAFKLIEGITQPEKKMAEVPAVSAQHAEQILAELAALRAQMEQVTEVAAAKFGVPVVAVQMVENIVVNPLMSKMDPQIAAKLDGNAVAEGLVHVATLGLGWLAQMLAGKMVPQLPKP